MRLIVPFFFVAIVALPWTSGEEADGFGLFKGRGHSCPSRLWRQRRISRKHYLWRLLMQPILADYLIFSIYCTYYMLLELTELGTGAPKCYLWQPWSIFLHQVFLKNCFPEKLRRQTVRVSLSHQTVNDGRQSSALRGHVYGQQAKALVPNACSIGSYQ